MAKVMDAPNHLAGCGDLNLRKQDEKKPMSRTVISAEGVEKVVQTSNGQLVILDGIDLEINEGESVAIVGASGSGKTTLLGILAGLDTATVGIVNVQFAFSVAV